jgi:hypothetical protein
MKKSLVRISFALVLIGCMSGCNESSSVNSSVAASSSASSVISSVQSSETPSSSFTSAFTQKSLDTYVMSKAGKAPLNYYFKGTDDEIPYISISDGFNLMSSMNFYQSFSLSEAGSDKKVTVTIPNNATAVLDFANETISIPDCDRFFSHKGEYNALDAAFSNLDFDAQGNPIYLKTLGTTYYVAGKEKVYDLKSYNIPMVLEGQNGYLPLQTFSDIFYNPFGLGSFYNGQNVFLYSGSLGDMADPFYASSTGNRSDALADFTYDELCLNFDYNYGLKKEHDITDFDDFFTRLGRKEDLLSADPKEALSALIYILRNDLDDGHSNIIGPSYLAGKDFSVTDPKYKGISNNMWDEESEKFSSARTSVLGTYKPFEIVGDTAFLTFDEFMSNSRDYYASAPTEADAGNDTVALVAYAHTQILANSAVKNVVVDLSVNQGGQAAACAYIASWLLGTAYINLENPQTGSQASYAYKCDINFDGKFDDSDTIQGHGLNLYGLISPVSFSCGNLLPSIMKESKKITLLGQRSSGGSCVVGNTTAADGTLFRISSSKKLCTSRNGVFTPIDDGIEPDHYISNPTSFYDRTKLLVPYIDGLL